MEAVDSTQTTDWRATLKKGFAAETGAQRKFAREVNCSESHLSLVLKGERRLSYPLAQRINAKTGVPIEKLMAPPLAPAEPAQ